MSKFKVPLIVLALVVATVLIVVLVWMGPGDTKYVRIGTGGQTGVYYVAGTALSKYVNKGTDRHHIQMTAEPTAGSVYNINALSHSDLDFGIAQSDRHYQAFHGLAEWKDAGRKEGLRSICNLHVEAVTLVAAVDANINSLADLKGKKVNIGAPGSGQRGNAIALLRAAGIDPDMDIQAEGFKTTQVSTELQNGRIDAFFYTVGHPNGAITEATAGQRRKVKFVPITGMDAFLQATPYYVRTTIPKKLYPNAANTGDVPTIGMVATLLTYYRVPDDIVYVVTKALFENLDEFRKQHPCFQDLKKEEMVANPISPLHPGAEKYLKEAGLLK